MKKLNILVPYRDRFQQKKQFLDKMSDFLDKSRIDNYEIFIMEQIGTKEFNKGCLINIEFKETHNKDVYYCFNDVDTIPIC